MDRRKPGLHKYWEPEREKHHQP
ncbi:hypothetical protein AZZ68_001819, partial [Klebsiella pneumoniae]